jgi:D-alanyl-lipoteichoic acid acyltransferase DltB (MBOAT superfamily)
MVFNSYTFALFFLMVLFAYYSIKNWKQQKLILLIASYIFYAAWNPPFVALLWLSTIVDWYLSKSIYKSKNSFIKRFFLLSSLVVNLGLLSFFKYGNFLLDNFISFVNLLGINFEPVQLNIILPVGISFYTFQTLSYTLDVYFGKAKPWHSFLDYALYVTFFPQLVAGPIVRASDFLQQCEFRKTLSFSNLSLGLSLMTLGLFEKVVVADALLAPVTEGLYSASGIPSFSTAWAGTLAFAGQIFCDFAGYSTCAIGAALCLGFTLPRNFHFPYAAVGFSDFWRRWHISLSTWLRDYLYIPLGGNRKGSWRTQINLMVTMLLGGLWHGASWTFVIWGGLHGLYLIVERSLKNKFHHYLIWKHPASEMVLAMITFLLVCFTWVFFRATSFKQALDILGAMLGISSEPSTLSLGTSALLTSIVVMGTILVVHWLLRNCFIEDFIDVLPWWVISFSIAGMLYAIVTLPGQDRSFIYFQF